MSSRLCREGIDSVVVPVLGCLRGKAGLCCPRSNASGSSSTGKQSKGISFEPTADLPGVVRARHGAVAVSQVQVVRHGGCAPALLFRMTQGGVQRQGENGGVKTNMASHPAHTDYCCTL